jgi:O-antigen ligase
MLFLAIVAFVVAAFWGLMNPFAGLLGMIGVNTLRPGETWQFFNAIYPEKLMALVVAVSWMIHRGGKLEIPTITRRVLLFWGVMFLGVPFSPVWRLGALMEALDFGKTIIYHVMVVNLVNNSRRLLAFVVVFSLIMGIVSVWGLYLFSIGRVQLRDVSEGQVERARVRTSNFQSPNALGLSMALALPVVAIAIVGGSIPTRILSLVVLILIGTTLVLTGSRAAFFTILFMIGMAALNVKRRVAFGVLAVLAILTAWILMPEAHRERYLSVTSLEGDEAYNARIHCRQAGYAMIRDYPIFGVGVGQFGTANGTRYWPGPGPKKWLNAHNLFIQVPAELGIFGVVAFSLFVWQALKDIRLARGMANAAPQCPLWMRYLPVACLMCVLGLLFSGLSAHTMLRDTWYLITGAIAAQLAILKREYGVTEEATAGAGASQEATNGAQHPAVTRS